MRTTLNLRDDLLQQARAMSGLKRKTDIVHAGLEALVQQLAAKRLAKMGGIDPSFRAPPRRRNKAA